MVCCFDGFCLNIKILLMIFLDFMNLVFIFLNDKCVLVVEDDVDGVSILEVYFCKEGFFVVVVYDGL